jgi:hypothetical protein
MIVRYKDVTIADREVTGQAQTPDLDPRIHRCGLTAGAKALDLRLISDHAVVPYPMYGPSTSSMMSEDRIAVITKLRLANFRPILFLE